MFPASAARHGNCLRHGRDTCTDDGIRNACCPLIRRYLRTGERVACVKRIQTMNRGSSIGEASHTCGKPSAGLEVLCRENAKLDFMNHPTKNRRKSQVLKLILASVPLRAYGVPYTWLEKHMLEPQPPCNPSRIRGPWDTWWSGIEVR
jgi:hypothetical protein